jgi:hypothetical protein
MREALIGDLLERYGVRPSRLRYWRQVLTAIVTNAIVETLNHKMVTLRALIAGCLSFGLLQFGSYAVADSLGESVWTWTVDNDYRGFQTWWFTYQLPGIMALVMSGLGSGWVAARLNRDRPAAVLLFAALIVLINAYSFVVGRPPLIVRFFVSGGLVPYFVVVQATLFFVIMPTLVLLGGVGRILKQRPENGLA